MPTTSRAGITSRCNRTPRISPDGECCLSPPTTTDHGTPPSPSCTRSPPKLGQRHLLFHLPRKRQHLLRPIIHCIRRTAGLGRRIVRGQSLIPPTVPGGPLHASLSIGKLALTYQHYRFPLQRRRSPHLVPPIRWRQPLRSRSY